MRARVLELDGAGSSDTFCFFCCSVASLRTNKSLINPLANVNFPRAYSSPSKVW